MYSLWHFHYKKIIGVGKNDTLFFNDYHQPIIRKVYIKVCLYGVIMEEIRSRIIKGGKDRKGRIRKFIPVPTLYYDEYEFGDVVIIQRIKKDESNQEAW